MIPSSTNAELHETITTRAKELFREQQRKLCRSTDRLFAGLMFAQWLAAIFAAFYISPQTWEGSTSRPHLHIFAAIFLGGLISAFPIFLALAYSGRLFTRLVIASAQMLMSGLLIHLSGGRIETHFHIFGSLAFLAFYRDWRVLVPATIVTSLDHFARGIFWPESIYGVLTASPWRTLEHVGWVAFENVFLVVLTLRSVREMRAIAWHTAQLETTNQVIEEKVIQRTAEVKSSEERFRLLVDGVQDYAIIMLDPEGTIVSWNEGARRVSGYAAEDVVGQHVSIFHPTNDRNNKKPHRDLATAATVGRYEDEGWRVREDGSQFWANVVVTALYDDANNLRGFSKITRDITTRREAEEVLRQTNDELERRVSQRTAELAKSNGALQAEISDHQRDEAEIRLQNALLGAQGEAAIEGILVVNAEGEISSFNLRFTQLWGLEPDDISTQSASTTFQSILGKVVNPGEFESRILELYRDRNTSVQQEINLTTGGIFEYYSAPLIGADSTYYGRIWFFRDVTESRKVAEVLHAAKVEAERANAAKSEFLSRMSHELRTPMNAILGFGQLLQLDDLSEDQHQSVDQILKGGRHLLGLINEVLEISRIEAGHMSISLEPVNLSTVLQEALDLVGPLATTNSIELDQSELCTCSHIVMADQQRLKQVILNLLSNAIKYNKANGTVAIGCEQTDHRMRLSISDTGNGISAENLKKLFKPFERLGAERTNVEGNGIGLSLSRHLMHLMGGEIGLESEVGQGTTFWIELPRGQEAQLHPHIDEPLAFAFGSRSEKAVKPTILYVEDNLSNLRLVESILDRHFDAELLSAMQGSLGLELARQNRPDLILLDLHLPDIMGDKVLAQLQTDPITQNIPVVILSADATERQIQKLLDSGAKNYLTKPIDVNRFMLVLEENLERHRSALTT